MRTFLVNLVILYSIVPGHDCSFCDIPGALVSDVWKVLTKSNLNLFELTSIKGDYRLSEHLEYYFSDKDFCIGGLKNVIRTIESYQDVTDAEIRIINAYNEQTPPMITTKDGVIKGKKIKSSITGRTYFAYRGIPYAERPRRWQAPIAVRPWKGILDATKERNCCSQLISEIGNIYSGSEDCLRLNVFVDSLAAKRYPVMVMFHGGRFKSGNASPFTNNPSFLLQQGIIVVTVYYRLGVLGFLSSGTRHAPGNAGMKDTIMALKWIKRNIYRFGGDPKKITIFGNSSGSAMVELLMISPMARGLFDRVVMQSGSALGEWSVDKNPQKAVFKLAGILNINSTNIIEIMKRLEYLPAKTLVEAAETASLDENMVVDGLLFTPCIEKALPGVESFLREEPLEMLKKGKFNKVPVMQSCVSDEGNFFVNRKDSDFLRNIERAISPKLLHKLDHIKKKLLIKKVQQFYFGNIEDEIEKLKRFAMLIGDVAFVYPMYRSTILRLNHTTYPIYSSVFAFDSELGTIKLIKENKIPGVSHSDDLNYYVTQYSYHFNKIRPVSKMVNKRAVTMLANFIKFGNPTPKIKKLIPVLWDPIQSENSLDYLYITETMEMKENFIKARMQFWDSIYKYLKYI